MKHPRALGLSALLLAACGAQVLGACGGSSRSDKPAAPPRTDDRALPPAAPPPSRYLLTEGMGVSFDEAGSASPLPRREPAIVSGERLMLEGGVVVAAAPSPEPLRGFRAIPARLGGGFLLWSDARTYRADAFLGALEPLVDVAAEGGARPWLSTIALRTDLGLLELDPGSRAVKRTELARFSEVLSLDGKRGVRVDALGHAEVTSDGGARWTSVKGEHGMLATVTSLLEGKAGAIELINLERPLVLGPDGSLAPVADEPFRGPSWDPMTPAEETQPQSRQLASSDLASAVFAGALVPGGRALVTHAEGLRVFSVASGQIVDDAPWASLNVAFSRCQPAAVGEDVLLACMAPRGAHVLALGGDPSAPRLEATFPDAGGGFVQGLGRRFGRVGRCGSEPPGVVDFGGTREPEGEPGKDPAPAPEEEPGAEPPPQDRASFCIREAPGTWTARRLAGHDAVHLYRFLPGDAGHVTALVLEDARGRKQREKAPPDPVPEGVRVLRIDPDDPALAGALFPALPTLTEGAPYRTVDADYWLDAADGSVHGWVQLPLEGEPAEERGERELVPQGASGRMLPVSTRLGGPVAGIRIGPEGAIEVHPLPPGVVEVVRGGRFALARADVEGAAVYHETTDGGRTWRPVLGPPVGELAAPGSDVDTYGCSALGCTFAEGLVRLGWGGPPPPATPPTPPELGPAKNPALPRLSALPLRCRLEATAPDKPAPRPASDEAPAAPVSLRAQPGASFGAIRGDTWTAEVLQPFDPSPAPRRVTAKIAPLSRIAGDVVPVLGDAPASPVELFLRVDDFRFDLGKEPSRAPVPLVYRPRLAVAGVLGPGQKIALDADSGYLVLLRDGSPARTLLRANRLADVTRSRLTLARASGGKGRPSAMPSFALATVSPASGDILLGELDLTRGQSAPLRLVGNLGALDTAPACRADPLAYRLLADVTVDLRFEPAASELDAPYLPATALVSVSAAGAGRACLEGLEVRLPSGGSSLAVRFSAPSGALVRKDAEAARRASCASP